MKSALPIRPRPFQLNRVFTQSGSIATGSFCRWAGREVRFGPKTDLIPMPNPVAHASRLCNRTEEYGHAGSSECDPAPKRVPWNKGKLTGAKPPLRPKHVWSIRTKLRIEGHARDLAMFNLAIDSKLRAHQDRKHGQISRHRSRRCTRNSGTS
jgi:hypothetical protein